MSNPALDKIVPAEWNEKFLKFVQETFSENNTAVVLVIGLQPPKFGNVLCVASAPGINKEFAIAAMTKALEQLKNYGV